MTEQSPTTLTVAQVADRGSAVLDEVATLVVGMREPLTVALAAILGGGHVLFEDVPGLGKTLAARSLATALGLTFRRVQCTPDLLPSDITGSSIFDPGAASFAFRPGPVFAGLLLADAGSNTLDPVMSDGSRSGVHCTRRNVRPSAVARLRAASVLPRPGTSSNSTWPPASTAASAVVSGSRMPTTRVATSSRIAPPRSATSATVRVSVM